MSPELPRIVETKRTLAGREKIFQCRLLSSCAPDSVVLLFVSDAAVRVHDLALPAGTVTFGYFWRDRPYNVYHWMTPAGATLACYVNLADATTIDADHLRWRDLTVDVLLLPGAAPVVLDEDELPADLDAATRAAVAAARDEVLASAEAIRAEVEGRSHQLWPRAFAGEGRR